MDIAYLVSDFIKSLSWQFVVVYVIWQFRVPISEVLFRFKGAGLPGGVSLDFSQEVRDAQELSAEVAKAPRKQPGRAIPSLPLTEANTRMLSLGLQPSPSGLDLSRYFDLAQQDPNLALAGLRMEVEILARNLANQFKIDIGRRDSAGTLLRRLFDQGAITSDQHGLAQSIVRLCNAAVHGRKVSWEEAERVIDAARVLAKDYLDWLSWGFGDGWQPPAESES